MRRLYHWLISLGVFGLLLVLAACGVGSTGPTTGSNGNGSTSPTTSTGNTTPTPPPPGTSTINFTASGGLSGPYMLTIPIESNDNQLVTTPKNKQLTIKAISDV